MNVFSANITGSDAYWHKRKSEFSAVFEQKGPPTFFFANSMADNHWEDLHRLVPDGLLDPSQRFKNVKGNAHLIDWYFSYRFK